MSPPKIPEASGSVRSDPVTVHGDELLVLRIGSAGDGERRHTQQRGLSDFPQHWNPPLDGDLPVLQVIGMNSRNLL